MTEIKQICVYCGSSPGATPQYQQAAKILGQTLATRKIDLVYGGADIGLMGAVANAVLTHGGKVTGVIPKALYRKEVAHQGLSNLEVVADMHERKARMAELADGFVTLPGGLGTLEELFEMLTWSQLGFHEKPIGLLNIENYYTSLLEFIQHSVNQGFVKPIHQQLFTVSDSPETLIDSMNAYRSPIIDKWTEKAE